MSSLCDVDTCLRFLYEPHYPKQSALELIDDHDGELSIVVVVVSLRAWSKKPDADVQSVAWLPVATNCRRRPLPGRRWARHSGGERHSYMNEGSWRPSHQLPIEETPDGAR